MTLLQNTDVGGVYLLKKCKTLINLKNEDSKIQAIYLDNFDEDSTMLNSAHERNEISELNNVNNSMLMNFEYHVLYHLSYAVPYLCFNANKSGILISIY